MSLRLKMWVYVPAPRTAKCPTSIVEIHTLRLFVYSSHVYFLATYQTRNNRSYTYVCFLYTHIDPDLTLKLFKTKKGLKTM